MAEVTKDANASVDASTAMMAPQITGLIAGENIAVAAPCYIASDGKVYEANGTTDDEKADVAGFAPRTCTAGEPLTLYGVGARFRYGTNLTPGARLYLAGTDGKLDTAPTVGDPAGIARVITATDIVVITNAVYRVEEVS